MNVFEPNDSQSTTPVSWKGPVALLVGLILFYLIYHNAGDAPKQTITTTNITKADTTVTSNAIESFADAYNKADTSGSYAIRDTVKTGNFAYKIHGIGYNKTVGSEYYERKADGVYLAFWLYYTNISSATQTLDNSDFKLVDEQGNEYDYSVEATEALELSGAKTIAGKQCSQKVRKLSYLCFEVPKVAAYYLLVPSMNGLGTTASIRIPAKRSF